MMNFKVAQGGQARAKTRAKLFCGVALSILSVATASYGQIVSDPEPEAPMAPVLDGIREETDSGDLTISVDELATWRPDDSAIVAINSSPDGTTSISANRVRAGGINARAIAVRAVHDIKINATTLVATGQNGNALELISDTGTISVDAGEVAAFGQGGSAIIADTLDGDVIVKATTIRATGAQGFGIFASTVNGNVTINATTARTDGTNGDAIVGVSTFGTTEANIGSVLTLRDGARGVFLAGGSGVTGTMDKIETSGFGAIGVRVVAGNLTPDVFTPANVVLKINTINTKGAGAEGSSIYALGNIDVTVGEIHTQGEIASGLNTRSELGNTKLTVDTVTTLGEGAVGILAQAIEGDVTVSLNKGSTEGDGASVIFANADFGNVDVLVKGDLSTKGNSSRGVLTASLYGDTKVVTQGVIKTTGFLGRGIDTNSAGGTTITANEISTQGDEASGIYAFAGDAFGFDPTDRNIDIVASKITTSGTLSHGIEVINIDGGIITRVPDRISALDEVATFKRDITIKASNISVTGQDSAGISVQGVADVFVEAGSVSSSKAEALRIDARNTAAVNLTGAVASLSGTTVLLKGADVNLLISKAATIKAAGDAIVLSAVGPYVPPDDGGGIIIGPFAAASPGVAIVENRGDIAAPNGAAIRVTAGTSLIKNSGRITGAIILADGDDVVDNSGTLLLSPTYDFGDGQDHLINSGTLKLADSTTPQVFTILGLERLSNNGGLLDFRNGSAGDIVTLAGAYSASGDARLALDVGGTKADKLVVSGAVSGKTSIILQGSGADKAVLLGQGVQLVSTASFVSADAFTLEKSDIGLIRYNLRQVNGGFALTSQAGVPIQGVLLANQAGAGLIDDAGDAWSSTLATARTNGGAGAGKRVWAQAYSTAADYKALASDTIAVTADQDISGGQFGGEIGFVTSDKDTLTIGLTGGMSSSNLTVATTQKTKIDGVNAGVYLAASHGSYFFNALAQVAHQSVDVDEGALGYSSDIDGTGYGVRAELGVKFKGAWLTYEPLIALGYSRTSWDDLEALGQSFAFDETESLIGKVGGRISGQNTMSSGASLSYYARVAAIHQFKGMASGTFRSGAASEAVSREGRDGTGEAAIGVVYTMPKNISLFLEAGGTEGRGYSSANGRIGLRYRF